MHAPDQPNELSRTMIGGVSGADEVVQRHPVGIRQCKEQFQGWPSLPYFKPRERALGDTGGVREAGEGDLALCAESLEPRADLVERGGDGR